MLLTAAFPAVNENDYTQAKVEFFLLARRTPERHKVATIRDLLATYPELPFILIGDSGQHDLDFYLAAARAHPGRISSILIRNVSNAARTNALRELRGELSYRPGDAILVYRAHSAADLVFRAELEQLAQRRGITLHYLLGPREPSPSSGEKPKCRSIKSIGAALLRCAQCSTAPQTAMTEPKAISTPRAVGSI